MKEFQWPEYIRRPLPWEKTEPPNQPLATHGNNGDTNLDKRISAYLAAIPGAVSGQGGHNQTFKVACYLVNGWELSAAEAMPYMQTYNQRCEPPWTNKELAHKLADAEKVQHTEPRGHLRAEQKEKSGAGNTSEQPRDPFGPNGGGNQETPEHEVTDEELSELDKAELERYHFKDRPFPLPMANDAFYGVAGDIVGIIQPASEASREAILAQLLVAIGNLIGRGPHRKQAGIHHLNEFTVLVGETATARKGTSWVAINNLLKSVNEDWLSNRLRDGFQSGESVIHAVRDAQYGIIPVNKRKAGQAEKAEKTLVDEGVSDKRLLIVEEEFARLLTVASRPGNTLSSTLRKAWDAKQWLHTEGKISPEKATGAHISMIGHVTIKELLDCLTEVENRNGFSNRVLWIATKRGQKLPLPPWIDWRQHPFVLKQLAKVIEHLGAPDSKREIHWSDEAEKDWCKFYKSIKTSAEGIVGSIVARSDAHVLRLTMLFAVLDASSLMKPEHLKAAIAFWQYCERSASWIFGEKTGNKAADKIYWALQREPKGITRTQLSLQVFNNHISKTNMDIAFSTLVDAGLARFKFERVKGDKPIQRWFEGH
jgi:hypothetical protein